MGWGVKHARDVPAEPGAAVDGCVPTVLTQLAEVEQRQRALSAWNDRMGSAIKASWHWRLMAFGLLLLVCVLVWKDLRPRTDILPYLYVMTEGGTVLWEGIPGSFSLTDVQALNRLEEWLEWSRGRTPDMTDMHQQWTRAANMTAEHSDARQVFNAYMDAENPLQLNPKPRVQVRITGKRVKDTHEYRLSWMEERLGPQKQVLERSAWEGDFQITLVPPRKLEDIQKARYGLLVTNIIWGPVVQPVGG